MSKQPNVVYVFSDQQRKDAIGYAGNPDVRTPYLDQLKQESISFETAVSGMPVCAPYRASLMTGQYPLTHGVFVNDVPLGNDAVSLGQAFKESGYDTAYIGKWHINANGRSNFIPRDRRQGFDYWQVLECTHDYNQSYYYEDGPEKKLWEGYDAQAQTRSAQNYIASHPKDKPFLLVLSWGPPHNPYETAPQNYQDMYDPASLTLRPNVPEYKEEQTRQELAGYYAHISALDDLVKDLDLTLHEAGIAEDTIFVFTSDHGDMIGSQGEFRKQRPWDESILVPFLLRYPRLFGRIAREVTMPINTPDIMPTLLGLSGIGIPHTVEGTNYAPYLQGAEALDVKAALYQCIQPFGEWTRIDHGGKECRGIRTERYTYVRDLQGPWLLYDNQVDPYQMHNLCNQEEHAALQQQLDVLLQQMLRERKDEFLPGDVYVERWGYITDPRTGTVPYEL
jgi:arylsulfatase A-like enzyme